MASYGPRALNSLKVRMTKLYRGACLAVFKRLPAGSVDAVVIDPP